PRRSAMVTLFELLVVNNWFVIMDGFVAAAGTRWARLFFIAFYVTAVIIVLNLVRRAADAAAAAATCA
ncbi:MAG: hypothetical protein ACK4ZJ_19340, partial [Allorhizobium sp.]